jgi:quercetin dioxygenase-like cupin family protein
MAKAGEELVNPATGLRTVFRETARTTGGELLQVDWIGESRWTTGPDHLHPFQEERFEVLSGTLGLRVAGLDRRHDPGDAVVVPAGVPHAAWNAGEDDVHVLVDFRPALRTEVAFETLAGLARDGKTTAAGVPRNPLRLALVLRAFENEIRFVRPPLAVQKAILGPLAAIGRMLGYHAEYPYRHDGSNPRSSPTRDGTAREDRKELSIE